MIKKLLEQAGQLDEANKPDEAIVSTDYTELPKAVFNALASARLSPVNIINSFVRNPARGSCAIFVNLKKLAGLDKLAMKRLAMDKYFHRIEFNKPNSAIFYFEGLE